MSEIKPKERDALIQALRSGVVPRLGQRHIQVGRAAEVKALIKDIERIAEGGSSFRLAIGEYGSGKTFFLLLVRSVAMEHKLVTVNADLSPDRRLHATGGQARSLYAELMKNMSTRSKPDGGALEGVVERFVTGVLVEAKETGDTVEAVLKNRLDGLRQLAGGYDFAQVIEQYWKGHDEGDDQLKNDATRWLRGEFATKTDARKALGVRSIVDDANFYDQLKLMAKFVRLAGYSGLLVCLDEMVNLYKLANPQARSSNYEQILRILNDSLQGSAEGLGFILGGTPEFLLDTRRGLYSYTALQTRLEGNRFAVDGLVDYTGPVISLENLSPEDLYLLLGRIRAVFREDLLPDEALVAFMNHCSKRIGDAYFRTPRNTIKEFASLLAVLEQNPGARWEDLLGAVKIEEDKLEGEDDNELSSVRL